MGEIMLENTEFSRGLNALADYLEAKLGKVKIVVVDLFCGGGGFSTGAVQAGATIALAVDFWEDAEKVHHANHPTVPFVNVALGDLDADLEMIRHYVQPYLDMGYHFHLHGSPPCQAISNASRRDASEGMPMVYHYLDLVAELEPDSWSMENVPPVQKLLPNGVPSIMLNAADFGVPQQRRRCFAGEGWAVTKTHENKKLKSTKKDPKRLPFKTVIDALPHLEGEYIELLRGYSRTRPIMDNGVYTGNHTPRIPPDGCVDINEEPSYAICGGSLELWGRVIELAEGIITQLIDLPDGDYMVEPVMDSGRSNAPTCGINPATGEKQGGSGPLYRSLEDASYTITSSSTSIGMVINNASVGNSNSDRARSADVDIGEPSNTVTGRGFTVRVNPDGEYRKVRNLTIDEMAALQDFPTGYDFDVVKTKKSKHLVVGNAVCPAVAKAVIEGIDLGYRNV